MAVRWDGLILNLTEIMLDMEMSPIVSVRSAAMPAFLVTKSEVFALLF